MPPRSRALDHAMDFKQLHYDPAVAEYENKETSSLLSEALESDAISHPSHGSTAQHESQPLFEDGSQAQDQTGARYGHQEKLRQEWQTGDGEVTSPQEQFETIETNNHIDNTMPSAPGSVELHAATSKDPGVQPRSSLANHDQQRPAASRRKEPTSW